MSNQKEEDCALFKRCESYYGGCLGDPSKLHCFQKKRKRKMSKYKRRTLNPTFRFSKQDCRHYFLEEYKKYKLEGQKVEFLLMLYYYFQVQSYKISERIEKNE